MCTKIPVWTLSFGLFLAVAPFSLSAQQGTLAGTVTDVLTLAPVPGAEIQILGGGETRTVVANTRSGRRRGGGQPGPVLGFLPGRMTWP